MADIEEQLKRSYWIQETLSSILKLSLDPISLKEQLERALDLILSIPWLSLESKGCIFLVDEDRRSLILTVQNGLSEDLLTSCARIPLGFCLCGQAASTVCWVCADHLDKRHQMRYEGIEEHGHYCVPIMIGQQQLGVINAYIRPGHEKNKMEVVFFA
ncbi:MAG: GAF domain-containing protein [Nitrospirota bacterium]